MQVLIHVTQLTHIIQRSVCTSLCTHRTCLITDIRTDYHGVSTIKRHFYIEIKPMILILIERVTCLCGKLRRIGIGSKLLCKAVRNIVDSHVIIKIATIRISALSPNIFII